MSRGAPPCQPGCTCGRHRYYGNGGGGRCKPGCKCERHRSIICGPECTCGRHKGNGGFAPVPWIPRFFSKVDKKGPRVSWMKTRCWLWTGAIQNGYGVFSPGLTIEGKKTAKAHRWLWEDICGPVPVGLELDHKCRVRRCVRPSHLEPVTKKENWERSRPWRDHIKMRINGKFAKREGVTQ